MAINETLAGTTIKLGVKDYIIPPLNFAGVVKVAHLLPALENGGTNETFLNAALEILHIAMVRNYPDLAIKDLAEIIDLGNLPAAMQAAMGKAAPPG